MPKVQPIYDTREQAFAPRESSPIQNERPRKVAGVPEITMSADARDSGPLEGWSNRTWRDTQAACMRGQQPIAIAQVDEARRTSWEVSEKLEGGTSNGKVNCTPSPRRPAQSRCHYFKSFILIAFAGHASMHAPHFEHSGMCPEWGSSFSGHASTHEWQSIPLPRKHFDCSTRGRSVRFAFAMSEVSALIGQIFEHHFRSTVSSKTRIIGKTTSAHDGSLNWNRCQRPISVANVRPTGHTRQNTGNPNTAADASVPASTAWRASS